LSATNNDINSTEKLLNVIRGKDKESLRTLGKSKVSLSEKNPRKKIKIISPRLFLDKKVHTVGVDIDREFINLVKTAKDSGGRTILVDQKVIKYSQQQSNNVSEFNALLKSSLLAFCGSVANCNIWTKISANDVNVYFLKVPRVPKKQLENVVYWTAKKEGFVDETKSIFDFELQDEIVDQDKPKYFVMIYTAPIDSINKIRTLFSDIGITLAGITTVPFAIQNIFRSKWMPVSEEIFASLFIGKDFSRIDIYKKDNLVMSRGFKTGSSNSMLETIADSYFEKTGGLRLKNDEARKILLSLSPDAEKLKDTDAGYDLKKEEILEMISPIWERLARQVDLTLKTSAIGYQKVEKIYILSSVNFDNSVLNFVTDQLGAKTELFDPFKNNTGSRAAELTNLSERMLLSPALGFSLSDNRRTPNVIFTYKEKNVEAKTKRIDRVVFFSFAAALIICLATLIYQVSDRSILNKKHLKLEQELAINNPILSKDKVSKLADVVKTQKKITLQYVQRYLGLAAIGEVSDLTPQNINLISFKITGGDVSTGTNVDKKRQETSDAVTIEGVIFGDRSMLDSLLAQYVMKLDNSPMLSKVSIQKTSFVIFKKSEVLQFTLSAKIG
jgi:Tfp pilus assembly PilM family ATPase